ncbi:MAG: bifunctional 4-hydroxy-2-oxoglutarate aldolase/2-dehydro-3-deoxy-phosphogluconate aldolase [Planctomycetota bacterium]
MTRHEQIQRIRETAFIAVLRADSSEQLIEVGHALKAGGCNLIEVTMTTPNALSVIEKATEELGNDVLLGAGSVLDAETARAAILAGAEYIVSPVTNYDMIEMAHRYDKVTMPGAYTPTEAINAYQAGADFVKVFPAGIGGPKLIKAMLAPMPQLSLVPTGGVNLDTIVDFLDAGAAACGVGSALVKKSALQSGDMDVIKRTAAAFMEKVRTIRSS